MLATALAHGPAAAGLEVLAWSEDATCGSEAFAPQAVRTNVGVAAWNGATYDFGCPARWGDSERALVASSSDGQRLLLAGTARVYRTDDGGCNAEEIDIPVADTPVSVAHDGTTGWLLTRDFQGGAGALWRVEDTAVEVGRWEDFFPDEMLLVGDTVWLSGALPTPQLRAFREGTLEVSLELPEADDLQRLALRTLTDGDFVLHATRLDGRWLWGAGEGGARVLMGPADAIHGPVTWGAGAAAVVDGVLYLDEAEGWVATENEVNWTCLRELAGVPYVCTLEATYVVDDPETLALTPVFSLAQLGPPAEACDDVGGSCSLDWFHFGGESGWVESDPATCPLGERTEQPTPDDTDDPDTDDGSGCACSSASGAGAGVGLPWMFWALRRRRRGLPTAKEGATCRPC